MRRFYFDYAATTPLDPGVFKAMKPYFEARFGNPGSVHSFGQEAIGAIDRARERIADTIGAEFQEIIFVSSATEANNLILKGVVEVWRKKFSTVPKIIVSAIEHESVLAPARALHNAGLAEVVVLPVSKTGHVDQVALAQSIDGRTALVSVMYGNNEVGTVQRLAAIKKIIDRERDKESLYPLFHTDAVQAFQYREINVRQLGVDFLTLSSHKAYGPKGIATLYARAQSSSSDSSTRYHLSPLLHGGGQEFGLRSGTEAVPLIVGMAEAIRNAHEIRVRETRRLGELKDFLVTTLLREKKFNVRVNGARASESLPHIVSASFEKVSSETLLTALDLKGIAVSSGAACSMRSLEPSYVLQALGYDASRVRSSVRFSLGRYTTKAEITFLLDTLRSLIPAVRD